jgi:hypothetical protein
MLVVFSQQKWLIWASATALTICTCTMLEQIYTCRRAS